MPFTQCPKCGHAPLPQDQSLPAACPGCGVILAKISPADPEKSPGAKMAAAQTGLAPAPVCASSSLFFRVPESVSRGNWIARIATLVAFSIWTGAIFASIDIRGGEAGSFVLWAVLTPFHEAGHYLIFRWFGQFVMILGGTLGQHLMPLTCAAVLLLQRRDPFGASLFCWLFGFSVVLMAVYMYDAFDPRMTLLDGRTGADSDGHDWQNIFGDLGLLPRARGIGIVFGWVGRALMVCSLAWGGWLVWMQRAHLSSSPFAELDADA